ncbi:GNAT family N-acetyltransferase [Metabacillus iocasae]|uniref:Ribosomal protein S18 acetylase RimI-like enzyme n=1 Tax=Priestia iocasae TaxID=2291674 RepID=A0ABS2QUH4_9BACI|nr:GNAT family N-acetyltransferase [Metabacillus iocasae]MBM7702938.1 ribosomal protein S18 acetylase RimI-like enzyme [Metabacillus iocasae]
MEITIQKATMRDAETLTEIMKKTFDEEARKWLSNQEIVDYNIQPPGYSSIEMTKYMIEELAYYKIMYNNEIVGGIIVTITGKSFGRIDRIFVDPHYQGRNIGSTVIELMEKEFPTVRTWDLETSSRQVNNHHFYEKMGYSTTFTTDDDYYYMKRKDGTLKGENLVEGQDISTTQYENCQMERTECYQVNLAGSSFSNSNLSTNHFSNCNLSHSTFQNINLRHSLYADLNLSHSKMRLVTLGGVQFMDTNLGDEKAPISFERCDLQGTVIKGSHLKNVQIVDSDLTGMTINGISVEKLLEVYERERKK